MKLKLFEHPGNPLPPDGSVHEVRTADGYGLRLGLWPVPGLEIRIMPPRQPAKPAAVPVDSATDGPVDDAELPEADVLPGGAESVEKPEASAMPPQSGAPDPDGRDTDNSDAAPETPADAPDRAASKGSANPDDSKPAREPEPEAAASGDATAEPESGAETPDSKLSNGEPEDAKSAAPEAADKTADEATDEAVAPRAEDRALRAAASDDSVMSSDALPVEAKTGDAAEPGAAPESAAKTENTADAVQADRPTGSAAEANPAQALPGGEAARNSDPAFDADLAPAEDHPQVESKGTVILLGGRSEFIEKYAEVIGELIARDFCVAALDWRGQGGSERLIKGNPRKGHVDHIDSYVEDLTALLDFLDTTNCPKPYFCLAHSTGGQVLVRAAPVVSGRISRAVTTAPLLELAEYRLPKRLVYGLVATLTYIGLGELYAPGTGRNSLHGVAFEDNILNGDRRRYERTQALEEAFEELVIGGPTLSWVYAALKSAREIREPDFLARINLPMLMLSASEDRLVSSRAIVDFAAMVRTITHIGIPGSRHEILMERDEVRGQFWAAFDAFIPGDS